ncbi:MAG: beta-galactosidase [Ardenticatenaceae bacterium]|nr:beta-galactosidase [Ardenticatenaceae bacterium]
MLIYVIAILILVAIFAVQRHRALNGNGASRTKIALPIVVAYDPTRSWPQTPVGVQMPPEEGVRGSRSQAYAAGIRWVHIYLSWKRLEPQNTSPENFDWQAYDGVLADLSARGFQVIVNVDRNPSWAASSRRGPIDRTGLDEFEQFIGAVARRYSRPPYNLHHYQFYIEPDDWAYKPNGERGAWGGYGAEYAKMLERAYRAIHGADLAGKVILGGLANETWAGCDPSPCFDLNFLDDVVQAGGAPFIDIMNFHYYEAFKTRWTPHQPVGKALALRDKLPVDQRNKPFVCTEMGTPYWRQDEDVAITRERQARFVVQGFAHIMGASAYGLAMPACTWFSFETYSQGVRKFGLLDSNGAPLPAYWALKTLTTEVPERPVGVELIATNRVAGYRYTMASGNQRLILWTEDERTAAYDLSSPRVQVISIYGKVRDVVDGQAGDEDHQANRRVRIAVAGEPVIVRLVR